MTPKKNRFIVVRPRSCFISSAVRFSGVLHGLVTFVVVVVVMLVGETLIVRFYLSLAPEQAETAGARE